EYIRAFGRKTGEFVYVDAYAVAERVCEVFIEPRLFEHVSCNGVGLGAAHSVCYALLGGHMRGKDNFIRLFELFVLFIVAEEECARAVGAVPAPLAAEVHKNYIAEFQLARARFVMGNGAALAKGHYRIE